jgi:Ca2+/H+ antiporter
LILAASGAGAALVSDWFVAALQPAITALHLSQRFTGLVIVAIAGNAVENVVGVQLAARNRPDYAISVILNSSLQVALGLIPVLVLLSFVIGSAHRPGPGCGPGCVHRLRRGIDMARRRSAHRPVRHHSHLVLVGVTSHS